MSSLPESVEKVARELREDILRSRYRPGDRLPSERDLAERMRVNRGAVREALRSLAQLGILEIGPGGARAVAVEDASLEVIGHLLALEELPEPELVSQVMEVQGVMASGWIRNVIERDDEAEIAELRSLLRASADESLETPTFHELAHELIERSPNLVLRLMRKAMRLHFMGRLVEAGTDLEPPRELLKSLAASLDAALDARDGALAAELVHTLMKLHRERTLAGLEQERARSSRARSRGADAVESRESNRHQRPLED